MAHRRALNMLQRLYFTSRTFSCRSVVLKGIRLISDQGPDLRYQSEYTQAQHAYSVKRKTWPLRSVYFNHVSILQLRMYSVETKDQKRTEPHDQEIPSDSSASDYTKLSAFQKFKAMYRDYWYVLVPVHISSSIVFLGVFYYAASSGVDVVALLEKLNVSDSIINPLRDSSAGYIAITYALYKIFTPVRYTVTLGGTTWAIKILTARGLIKPRPMKEAKENVQNIITAMKMPENQRQRFLEEKGMPRIGKAVGQASNTSSFTTSSEKDGLKKK